MLMECAQKEHEPLSLHSFTVVYIVDGDAVDVSSLHDGTLTMKSVVLVLMMGVLMMALMIFVFFMMWPRLKALDGGVGLSDVELHRWRWGEYILTVLLMMMMLMTTSLIFCVR